MRNAFAAVIGIILVLAAWSTSSAQTYSDSYIHTPLNSNYTPEGINNAGAIVGYYKDGSKNRGFKFILSNGSYTPFDISEADATNITDINEAGAIVGYYKDTQAHYHGFISSDGSSYTALDYPGATNTYAQGINKDGTVVGWWAAADGTKHGFMWSNGNWFSVNYSVEGINATNTYAFGINDAGTIVGWWRDTNAEHGFTRSNTGVYKSFDYPDVPNTHAYGINNAGTIVGSFTFYNGTMKGFTLNNGVFAPIGITYAYGINDTGWIVGYEGSLLGAGPGFLLTGYTAHIESVANIDNVSDTFTVWLTAKQNRDGTPAPDGCAGVLKVVDASGNAATQQSCLDQGTGRYRFTLQIAGDDTQPKKRSRYVENASFYICNTMGSSAKDLPDCSLINGTPTEFSVYGTTFDIEKHAWKFPNGAWDNTPGQPAKVFAGNPSSPWWVQHNNFYKAASVIQPYVRYSNISKFWKDIGYSSYNAGRLLQKQEGHDSKGQCYGLANSAIANYTHQDDSAWGITPFTPASWDADIVSRWADTTKATSPFGVLAPGADIFTAPALRDPNTIWTIDSAKKIMYYFIAQQAFKGQKWVGQDNDGTRLNTSSEGDFIDVLKKGSPVSLGVNIVPKGGHEVAVPQLIIWNGHRTFMIWNNNYPLGYAPNGFGPYELFYLHRTSEYVGHVLTFSYVEKQTGGVLSPPELSFDGVFLLPSECGDSQNIYNQWTAPCLSPQQVRTPADATDAVDNPYPDHIEVMVIGAQINSVYDQTTSSSVTLIPDGDIIAGQAVKSVSGTGLFTQLYLPVSDTYQIQATKYAGFTGLKVFATIPKADGTVQVLNYDNLSTADADATHITFNVGRGNANYGISRTIANDTYNPDYNASLSTALSAPNNFTAAVNNSGTGVTLSWTNTGNPSLASVLVIRKVGSEPDSSTDGVTVFSAMGQSAADTVTANTVYYYAAYSMDNVGNPSTPTIRLIDTSLRSVYGTITLTGGGQLGNATLQVVDSSGNAIGSAISATNGAYAISNIANGDYTVTASHPTAVMSSPSVAVTLSGNSQQVDFSATNQPTLVPLSDPLSVSVGNTVSIPWAYRNIGNNQTVNISLFRGGAWETIASGVSILDGMISWTVTTPVVQSATLRIALASNPAVYGEYTFSVLAGDANVPYVDFAAYGLYSWNGTTWDQLTNSHPASMVASGSTLYSYFTGDGLYQWNGSAWTLLTKVHQQSMVASASAFYAFFTGDGLYSWNGSWTLLTKDQPSTMVASGSTLYADFPGWGVYSWNGSAWTGLTSSHPTKMAASGSTLYADFARDGFYSWNGSAWTLLTKDHPANILASGSSLYADFPGWGVYSWNDSAWTGLTSSHPTKMAASGSTLYADFAGDGFYSWNGSAWTLLTKDHPANILASGSSLYADFAAYGLYVWDGNTWTSLTKDHPATMVVDSGS